MKSKRKHFTLEELMAMPSRYKANFINSVTGYKSCTILATKNKSGITNLAIFNSVVHIGSHPPMLGFILRPLTVPRDTYTNFKQSGYFTVNQVHKDMITEAHHTSASYADHISEFDKTNLEEEYLHDFPAPYVRSSAIKIGCRYVNEYLIKENNTLLIIGAITDIYIPEDIQHADGWIQLDAVDTVSAIGLDGYALPKLLDRFAYAKPDEDTTSLLRKP